jgi:hypothetical protein
MGIVAGLAATAFAWRSHQACNLARIIEVVHVREQDLDENVSVKVLSNSEVIHIPMVI